MSVCSFLPAYVLCVCCSLLSNRLCSFVVCCLLGQAAWRRRIRPTIRQPYVRALGLRVVERGSSRTRAFSPSEEAEMRRLSETPGLPDRLAKSIAPASRSTVPLCSYFLLSLLRFAVLCADCLVMRRYQESDCVSADGRIAQAPARRHTSAR